MYNGYESKKHYKRDVKRNKWFSKDYNEKFGKYVAKGRKKRKLRKKILGF